MKDVNEIRKIYRRKAIFIFAIAAVSVLAYFFIVMYMLQSDATARQNRNNNRFFSSTLSNLNSNVKEMSALSDSYHQNNTILINNLVQAYSGSNYRKLRSLSVEEQARVLKDASTCMENCAWLLIVDKKGEVLVSDIEENVGVNIVDDTGNDMTMDQFKQLCNGGMENLVITNPYAEFFTDMGDDLYLYCKPIPGTYESDGAKFILLAFDSQILDTMEAAMRDLSSWINDSTIGNGGTAFVIDADTDTVKYGSILGTDMAGQKASEIGFSPELLSNRYSGLASINGTNCYITMRAFSSSLYGENNYIVTVVPTKNLYAINAPVVIWNICLFSIFLFMIIVYTSYVRGEIMKKGEPLKKTKIFTFKGTTISYSRVLAGKIFPIVFAVVFLVGGAVFYYQTLMKLSDCFSETVAIETDIMRSVEESSGLQKEFKYYYNMQYASRAEAISVIVSLNGDEYLNNQGSAGGIGQYSGYDDSGNRDILKDEYGNPIYVINNSKQLLELADHNGVRNISLISDGGVTLATSSDYWNYTIPTDQNANEYEFWDVLYGKEDHAVVDISTDEYGFLKKYVACSLNYYTYLDETGNTKYVNYVDYVHQSNGKNEEKTVSKHRGIVLMEILVGADEFVLDSSKPEYVLSNTKISNDGFLTGFEYDDEKEDYVVFYSQKDSLIGKAAKDLGVSEKAFTGNYNGFQKIDSDLYLESFREGEDYYISTSLPIDTLFKDSVSTAAYCALFVLLSMLIIAVFMVLVSDRGEEKLYRDEADPLALFFEHHQRASWKEKTSSQKFETIVQNSFILLGILFLITIIFNGNRLDSDSAIVYIVSGQWDRGIHIFSISACIVILIVASIIIDLFGKVSYILAEAFGNRVVTMMHMLISLIKTLAMILVLLYCLYLMGIDGTSLLASAGIMSVVVGLGAQSLVGDLLAGIFIILEGSLRVGDYVMIDGVRGRVLEIGLRITRYEDDNQNIRVICNNALKSFSNMSMKYSVVYYNIPVPYNEDYKRIKNVLNSEFLKLYEDNRFLKGIPACQGIEAFSESSVDIRVRFMCEESERYTVSRFMRDEIMRIFMENDITIPFNQLDIHVEHEHVLRDDVLPDGQ